MRPTPTTLLSPQNREKAAMRVLDALDRWDERVGACYSAHRQHKRNGYRTQINIVLTPDQESTEVSGETPRFQAWARNISQGGLSFIFDDEIPSSRIVIGLCGNAASGNWYLGEIVRRREVQEGFWEYGVALKGRIQEV